MAKKPRPKTVKKQLSKQEKLKKRIEERGDIGEAFSTVTLKNAEGEIVWKGENVR
jgi:hypothetical protein